MKSLLISTVFTVLAFSAASQTTETKTNAPDADKELKAVEVSCGKCKFGLTGKTCELAVRIADKAYYADGANIDDFGDAHEHDGLCNAIRKAEVQGDLVDGRFKVTYIKLLPQPKEKKTKE